MRKIGNSEVRVLSGSFHAVFHWLDRVGDEAIEKSTPVDITFSGALSERVNACWATGDP